MDWESLYGSSALYEERLAAAERERYAQRVWANNHAQRRVWLVEWLKWIEEWATRGGRRQAPRPQRLGKFALPNRKS
jgi:hypothetical protein